MVLILCFVYNMFCNACLYCDVCLHCVVGVLCSLLLLAFFYVKNISRLFCVVFFFGIVVFVLCVSWLYDALLYCVVIPLCAFIFIYVCCIVCFRVVCCVVCSVLCVMCFLVLYWVCLLYCGLSIVVSFL